jgi:hypothetical protein
LANTMSTIDSLHVDCRIVIVVKHDDSIGRREVEPLPANRFSHQQNLDIAVAVESLCYIESLTNFGITSKFDIIDVRVFFFNILFYYVDC